MIFLSGLIGFLLVLTAEARVGNSSQLPFCLKTKQCLLYDLICKTEEYEARHHDSVKWVSTDETSIFMEVALFKSLGRLYDYITGANENGRKIELTAPVVVKIPNKTFWESGVYTMSFLLPAEYQKNPPKPTDDKVYINNTPELKVYAQSYRGWMTFLSDKYSANMLSSALNSVGAKYKKGFHYAAGYDWYNEVWFVAEDDPVCPSSEEMAP